MTDWRKKVRVMPIEHLQSKYAEMTNKIRKSLSDEEMAELAAIRERLREIARVEHSQKKQP